MSVLEVTPKHMDGMGHARSVDLLRDLVHADAAASGIPPNTIDISSNITAPDGGVDGTVSSPKTSKHGIIKRGLTCYQINSGNFQRSQIEEILFNGDKLKSRIKSCLDEKGTLVVAFTGWDGPDREAEETKNRFIRRLQEFDPKYAGASVEIWHQNAIAKFLDDFPSLRHKMLGLDNTNFLRHEDWSRWQEMNHAFRSGREQDEQIREIRAELRKGTGPLHIRINGAPGAGKTRLIQEVTKAEDLRSLVMYAENPSVLNERGFLADLCKKDESQIILIADECDFGAQLDLRRRLENKDGVRLITIFNDTEVPAGDTKHFEVGGLGRAEIIRILQDYVGDGSDLGEWANFCGSSARAAHIVGENLKANPADILASPDTVDIWGRYIADQGVPRDSTKFETRNKVLMWLSLFKHFGDKESYKDEIACLRKLVCSHESISDGQFMQTLDDLRRRKIIQGHTTLYITPKALHVHLWIKLWKVYGDGMFPNAQELNPDGSECDKLLAWYMDTFEYVIQVPEARNI